MFVMNVVAIAIAAPGPKVAIPAPKATPVPANTPAPIELWSISLIFLFNIIFIKKNAFRVTGAIRTMPESESFQRFSAFRD